VARKNQYPARVFTDTHASCGKCSTMKEHTAFHKCKTNKDGLSYWCKECSCRLSREHHARRMREDKDYRTQKRSIYFLHTYGLTLTEYEQKLVSQGNICTICGTSLPSTGLLTHLDHDHKTGKLRDFLCTNCNRGLGSFKDSITNLEKAIMYLKTHSGSVVPAKEGRCL